MANYYHNQIFKNARVLFVIDGCELCHVWKKFIERLNFDIKYEKRINVVNATNLSRYAVYDNPLLKVFDKHLDNFPALFIEGNMITGANSRAEAESFIKAFIHEDFIIPQENKYLFQASCRIVKRGFFKSETLVCDEEEI